MLDLSRANFNEEQKLTQGQTGETISSEWLISGGGTYSTGAHSFTKEDALNTLLIIKDKDICQGKPVIKGTRIAVSNVVELYYLLGWDTQKIRDEYPHLNSQQIIAALEYYEKNTKEIDSYLQEEKEIDATRSPS